MSAGISHLRKLYDVNPSTGAFVIQVLIKQYSDLFNDLDPAPLRRRDLDASVVDYLEECSSDIPVKHKIELCFVAPESIRDDDREGRVRMGLSTWFGFTAAQARNFVLESLKRASHYVIAFFFLIGLSFFIRQMPTDGLVLETAREGIAIGSWVFLWEAFAIVFFKLHKLVSRYRKLARLRNAPLSFRYT